VHGFEEKVREALEQEKAAQAATHTETGDGIPLDGLVAAGIQELEGEADGGSQEPNPAIDAVVASIQGNMSRQKDEAASDTAEIHLPTTLLRLRKPSTWTAAAKDLFSERQVHMQRRDITLVALEGAATGAALVSIITALILRNS